MQTLINAIAAALILSTSIASFAQETQPVTRAAVQAQLIQLERAGYQPGLYDPAYPTEIQTAQARVDAKPLTTRAEMSGTDGALGDTSAVNDHASRSKGAAVDAHALSF